MASFTNPAVYATAQDLAVTDFNEVGQNTLFLYQRPYAMYYGSVGTSCPNSTVTQITLGGTTASGYGFSVVSNNIVVPLTAIYSISFIVTTTGDTGSGLNQILASTRHNGTDVVWGSAIPSYITTPASSGSGLVSCTAGDTLGLFLSNGAGSTVTTAAIAYQTFLHVAFVGSQ